MKPLVLELPDDVRNALETELAALPPLPPDGWHDGEPSDYQKGKEILQNAAAIFAKHLYPLHPSPEVFKFQQALLELQYGSGNPAIVLKNLPRKAERLFTDALFQFLDNRELNFSVSHLINPSISPEIFEFHTDIPYEGRDINKNIRGLYCANAGAVPNPTIFITADEIIDAMVKEKSSSPQQAVAVRKKIITALNRIFITTEDGQYSLLKQNPHAGDNSSAPKYILHSHWDEEEYTPRIQTKRRGMREAEAAFEDLLMTKETLREKATAESTASTEDKTLVIWNDPLVMHDRAHTQELDRKIYDVTAQPELASEQFLVPTPVECAVGSVVSPLVDKVHHKWPQDLSKRKDWMSALKKPTGEMER